MGLRRHLLRLRRSRGRIGELLDHFHLHFLNLRLRPLVPPRHSRMILDLLQSLLGPSSVLFEGNATGLSIALRPLGLLALVVIALKKLQIVSSGKLFTAKIWIPRPIKSKTNLPIFCIQRWKHDILTSHYKQSWWINLQS